MYPEPDPQAAEHVRVLERELHAYTQSRRANPVPLAHVPPAVKVRGGDLMLLLAELAVLKRSVERTNGGAVRRVHPDTARAIRRLKRAVS